MMDVSPGWRKPANLGVVLDNLTSALAVVADEYDKGDLSHDDWHRIRSARKSIEEAIVCIKPFCA